MGTDFDAHLAFGFILSKEEIDDGYMRRFDEISHNEVRYDEMTGEPRSVKVIDRAGVHALTLDGNEPFEQEDSYCGEYDEFLERLVPDGKTVTSVRVWEAGNLNGGEWPWYVVVGPGELDIDKLAALDPYELQEAREELSCLETRLRDLGFDPGVGGFHAYEVIG